METAWASIADKSGLKDWTSEDGIVAAWRDKGTFDIREVSLQQEAQGKHWVYPKCCFVCRSPNGEDSPLKLEFSTPLLTYEAGGTLPVGAAGLVAAFPYAEGWYGSGKDGDIGQAYLMDFHGKPPNGNLSNFTGIDFMVIGEEKRSPLIREPNVGIYFFRWPRVAG